MGEVTISKVWVFRGREREEEWWGVRVSSKETGG